jgi:methionyl-tRNA formyltransferase
MSQSLRVVFAGTPEFAVAPLCALLESRHTVVGVMTQPDRPAGRGRLLTASPVKELALSRGLPLAQPQTLRTVESRASLAAWNPDVLVVVAYGLILPPEALILPRFGCINVHASLLPRWRGAAPIQRAIMAGDKVTGTTVMQMDAGLDTGPILLAESLPIERTMDAVALRAALAAQGARLIVAALDALAVGALPAKPQPTQGATYAKKIARAEAPLDFAAEAQTLERQVRGLTPWPVAATTLRGEQLRIHAAVALEDSDVGALAAQARAAGRPPGTVLGSVQLPKPLPFAGKTCIAVLCGTGLLGLLRLQRTGKRALDAAEFARGEVLADRQLGVA